MPQGTFMNYETYETNGENFHSRTWQVSPELLGIADQAGVFIETNPAWQAVLGWSKAEIRENNFLYFVHPDDVAVTAAVFENLKQGHAARYYENRYRRKDASYRWISWIAVQEADVFVCSGRDVTQDKDNARALTSSEDEAILREQFVAILGHDLRNPLAAIGSAVRIAAREPHNKKIAEMFTSIGGSAERIAKLIDVTMDFARARLGDGIHVDLGLHDDLEARFERVIDEIRLAHPGRKIESIYTFDGDVKCDPMRLDELLSNLLANAVTHGSKSKPIFVRSEKTDGQFALSVTNSGKPIPADTLPNLFEPFSRSEGDSSLQGLGLGLYITSQIAKAHGGVVGVISNKSETTFRLKIPLPPQG
jgi:sigma-B regulation protein RsbU (phosphoserine phosphatase)